MTGGHGVSLKPCSEVNYAFRKREGVIERCAQFEKYIYDHKWLEGREYTGDPYKKLTNPWHRSCRLIFALTPVYRCPFEDKGPKQHSYILARSEPKKYIVWLIYGSVHISVELPIDKA